MNSQNSVCHHPRYRTVCLVILIAAWSACPAAEPALRPSEERIETLTREYARRINPTISAPALQFRIRKLEVPGLWEEMGVEVYDVVWTMNTVAFNAYVAYYHNDRLSVLVPYNGGTGLMSGVVHQGVFYFSYAWGTRPRVSNVGSLRLTPERAIVSDSGGFRDGDLFVGAKGDSIQVSRGTYSDFNQWTPLKDLGTVRAEGVNQLRIVPPGQPPLEPHVPH